MLLREQRYNRPYGEIFQACLRSIRQLGWERISSDESTGVIQARAGITLRSWGEDISIHLSRENTETIVSISSKPHSQVFDWGKSDENERILHQELKKQLEMPL